MLKQHLEQHVIEKLALIIAEKSSNAEHIDVTCSTVLNAYTKSLEYLEKQNEDYWASNQPQVRTL